ADESPDSADGETERELDAREEVGAEEHEGGEVAVSNPLDDAEGVDVDEPEPQPEGAGQLHRVGAGLEEPAAAHGRRHEVDADRAGRLVAEEYRRRWGERPASHERPEQHLSGRHLQIEGERAEGDMLVDAPVAD